MRKLIALFLVLTCVMSCVGMASAMTVLSSQNLSVDGQAVACEKYNIDGSNYFKLRDIAYVLNGTKAQFAVGWDAESQTISILTGEKYTPNGTELDLSGGDKSATAKRSNQTLKIDGSVVSGLSVYNIGGNNYFKLRDLGDALGFAVGYDAETRTATVDSSPAAEVYSTWRMTKQVSVDTYIETGYSSTTSNETLYTYNAKGELTNTTTLSKDASGNLSTSSCTYTYDANGNMLMMKYKDSDGYSYEFTYTYDANGRELSSKYVSCEGRYDYTASTYDANGNVVSYKYESDYGDGKSTTHYTYTYDENGTCVSCKDMITGVTYTFSETYDGSGLLVMWKEIGSDGSSSTSTYTYDANGNMQSEKRTKSDGYFCEYTYTYDANGNVLTENFKDSSGDFSTSTYTYDANGNYITRTYDTANYGYAETYTYDANGNVLTLKTAYKTGDTETCTYTYDANGNEVHCVREMIYAGGEPRIVNNTTTEWEKVPG